MADDRDPSNHPAGATNTTRNQMSAEEYLDLFWSVIKLGESNYNGPSSVTEERCEFDCRFFQGGLVRLSKAMYRMYKRIKQETNSYEETKRRRVSVSGQRANDANETDQQDPTPQFYWCGRTSPKLERDFVLTYLDFISKHGMRLSDDLDHEMYPNREANTGEANAGESASDISGLSTNTRRYRLLLNVIHWVNQAGFKVGKGNVANFNTLVSVLGESGMPKPRHALPPPPEIKSNTEDYENLHEQWYKDFEAWDPHERIGDYINRKRRRRE